jgi:hypothetical protein
MQIIFPILDNIKTILYLVLVSFGKIVIEIFEDTKVEILSRKLKNRKCNGQKKRSTEH